MKFQRNKITAKILLSLSILPISFLNLLGQTETQVNPDEVNELSKPMPSARMQVEEAFREFEDQQGISFGEVDDKGRIFYTGISIVSRDPSSSQWGKARVQSFENAFLQAQAKFALDIYGKEEVKISQRYFSDDSDGSDEFPRDTQTTNKVKALYDKLLALSDAKISQELEELGVDPSEFAALPEEQKITTFSDSVIKTITNKAIGQVSGLLPIKTFEGRSSNGNHAIGVVACYSPKLKQLSYDISKGKIPLLTGNPRVPLSDYIPSDPKKLASEFGLRVGFNEIGDPFIVSYGQWSHNYTGNNERLKDREHEAAVKQARRLANSYITLFLNSTLVYEEQNQTGEIIEDTKIKDQNGNITDESMAKIIDRINQEIEVTARADRQGRSEKSPWTYQHPSGNDIVGVVVTWTLDKLESAKGVKNWKSSSGTDKRQQNDIGSGYSGQSGVIESQDTDISDF